MNVQLKIAKLLDQAELIKNRCERENRKLTDGEHTHIQALLDEIEHLQNQPATQAIKPDPGGPGGTNNRQAAETQDRKLLVRSGDQGKTYRDLFGASVASARQWDDESISFFGAVLSGRHHPSLQRSMNEGTPSDGGFAVPTEYAQKIHDTSLENEIVMPKATVVPMTSDELKLPAFQIGDHSSNLFGGFTASYKPEAGTLTEANPKLRSMTLQASKLTGLVKGSNELAQDMVGGVDALQQICGKGLSWYRDKAFLKGSGAGEPLGILNSGALIAVSKEGGQAASTVTYQNLADMLARLWAGSFQNSIWICHQSTIPQLLSLSIAVGVAGSHYPALTEAKNGQWKMLTRPVIFTEKTETLGSQGDILLADFSQYVVGLRQGMRFDLSQHVYFTTDQFAARLIERHDAQPLWDEALTLEDGSTTVSPFVTLQART